MIRIDTKMGDSFNLEHLSGISGMRSALVVDDDNFVRSTVSALLESLKFGVVEAGNGKDALQSVSELEFDLIVTDLFMPDTDGIELIRQIRKICPKTPIILMTGGGRHFPHGSSSLNCLTNSAEFLGATYVIHKPFRKNDLALILGEMLL